MLNLGVIDGFWFRVGWGALHFCSRLGRQQNISQS